MARLFVERMKAARVVAEYKKENGLPIYDPEREAELIRKNLTYIEDEEYTEYYTDFQKSVMSVSKDYQTALISQSDCDITVGDAFCRKLTVKTGNESYPIFIGRDLLRSAGALFNLERRVIVVTDDGIPPEYAQKIASLCKNATVVTVKSGEESKSIDTLETLLSAMLEANLDRGDCAVAVGGGVVGDLTALAASVYMRGIDFYNVPTTLLSQVDSSIGGKTAVNFRGVKNIVGTFSQPKAVLIDADTLATLPKRHISAGLAEVIKMALTSNTELFKWLEDKGEGEIYEKIEYVISESLKIKRAVVEEDVHEKGIRKILNFGHTIGHGIEALGKFYHGECVALGMIPMCHADIKERVCAILKKFSLPCEYIGDRECVAEYATHDKKRKSESVSIVRVDKIGECYIQDISITELKKMIVFDN